MYRSSNISKRDPVSLIAIGRSGVGKSTIGNMFLTGDPEKPFNTSEGVESCTVAKQQGTQNNLAFTDVPGLPDTNPSNTVKFYNLCVDAIKHNEHSAILFVFHMGRIKQDEYRMAEMLFREMNKADCFKFLLINDRQKYAFGKKRPSDAEYKRLSDEIHKYMKINFDGMWVMNDETMEEQVQDIANVIKRSKVKPRAFPELKNFSELKEWLSTLKRKEDIQKEVIAEKERELATKQKRLKRKKFVNSFARFALGFMSGAYGMATLDPFGTAEGLVLSSTYGVESEKKRKCEIEYVETEITEGRYKLEEAIEEFNAAQQNFNELSALVESQKLQ